MEIGIFSPDTMLSISAFKNYRASILLLSSVLIGAWIGFAWGDRAAQLKPLGDIFLNLLFTSVVPLVFFSISSSVASMSDLGKLKKILGWMLLFFILTGLFSASLMVAAVKIYPPVIHPIENLTMPESAAGRSVAAELVKAFTVSDFQELISKRNMLALIVFSLIIGAATSSLGEKAKNFASFLQAGNLVMSRVIQMIMKIAPLGLGAYFAYLIGVFGPQLLGAYLRAMILYYPMAIGYFFVAYSLYAWLAGGETGFRIFWRKILLTSLTALTTGSSLAAVPANLEAADEIGVPKDISRMVIPIGATMHMDGTCLSAILKISILFSFFHQPFTGLDTYATAVGIALLSGVVMSGIPGGGFLGELLIVSLYGFPPEALPIISMVGTLVDPPATMVNSVGDNVVSMGVARVLNGPKWMEKIVYK